MGSGHRSNKKTALEMVGCEVVMTTGELLNSERHLLPLLLLLFLHCPPGETERRREEELRSSGAVNKEAGKSVRLCVCVCG